MLHSVENQQSKHDPSLNQGQFYPFNGLPKSNPSSSPAPQSDLDKEKEIPVLELEHPKGFQAQVLAEAHAIKEKEGGISGSQFCEIVARIGRERVWKPVCQAVQHNARIYLEQGRRLIEPFQGKCRYDLQYQELNDRIRLVLKETLDSEDREIGSTTHLENPAQFEKEPEQPSAVQTRFPSEPLTQEQIDFSVYNATITGSLKDAYFPAGITLNKILRDATMLLSPFYVLDIAAAILIQSADRDTLTAGITGLVFVVLSTIPFVFSAYYFAILKGHQKYKEAYRQNFPNGFKDRKSVV